MSDIEALLKESEAEVKRLKEALEKIKALAGKCIASHSQEEMDGSESAFYEASEIASAALESK